MKFGVTTYIWSSTYDATVEETLPRIREAGFDGIEFPIFRPEEVDTARARKALAASGLECCVSAVMVDGLSLISDDASMRKRALERVKGIVAATAEVGAEIVAGPLFCPVGYLPGRRRTAEEWHRAIEAYQQLGDWLDQHKVTLAIEPLNRFETFFLNTAADSVALMEAVDHPRIGILYDTFHANIEEKDIAKSLLTVGRYVKHIYTCENDRGTPGTGHVEWESFFAAVRELRYDGWLNIESFGFNLPDISAAAAIWRDIEASPAQIAYDGVRFLRNAFAG